MTNKPGKSTNVVSSIILCEKTIISHVKIRIQYISWQRGPAVKDYIWPKKTTDYDYDALALKRWDIGYHCHWKKLECFKFSNKEAFPISAILTYCTWSILLYSSQCNINAFDSLMCCLYCRTSSVSLSVIFLLLVYINTTSLSD